MNVFKMCTSTQEDWKRLDESIQKLVSATVDDQSSQKEDKILGTVV